MSKIASRILVPSCRSQAIDASVPSAACGKKSHGPAKRPPRPHCKPRGVPGTFADLCEISDGLAVIWRRKGCTEREMWAFAEDDPTILCDIVPALHALGFGEEDIIRNVPHDGPLAGLLLGFSRFMTVRFSTLSGSFDNGSGILALPPLALIVALRRALSRRIAALQNRAARPAHYETEKARRRVMAEERRRVRRRTTTSSCPTKEALLEAWRHVRDSKESLVVFGSMIQDLECSVDNSLRIDEAGRIVGRNAGIKGWLRENLPELAEHYTSVMRYKAAAKKLRQVVGLTDPIPVAAVLARDTGENRGGCISCDYGAKKNFDEEMLNRREDGHKVKSKRDLPRIGVCGTGTPPVEVVRARAVYLEVMEGVPDVTARVMARIDALCDPERLDEAATLRSWREKYMREITVRRKESWWRRLTA